MLALLAIGWTLNIIGIVTLFAGHPLPAAGISAVAVAVLSANIILRERR